MASLLHRMGIGTRGPVNHRGRKPRSPPGEGPSKARVGPCSRSILPLPLGADSVRMPPMKNRSTRIGGGEKASSGLAVRPVKGAPRFSLRGQSSGVVACLCLIGFVVLAAACTSPPSSVPAASSESSPAPGAQAAAYRLGTGDKLRVIVFGEEDLSGEFEVDDTGAVSMPLVGDIRASGQTLRTFEAAVRVSRTNIF